MTILLILLALWLTPAGVVLAWFVGDRFRNSSAKAFYSYWGEGWRQFG